MPRGGRRRTTWTKATRPKGGRKKGSKDRVPRSFMRSMRKLADEIAQEHPEVVRATFLKGLKAPAPKSFQYLNLMAQLLDGKMTDAMSADQVAMLVTRIFGVFIGVVDDVELRRRFVTGVRQLLPARTQVIDADVTPS